MDREKIDKSAAELIEIVELAGLGLVDWREFSGMLANIVPGCMSVFMQNDNLSPEFSLFAYSGVEQSHIDNYIQHFATINPWNNFWSAAKIGKVVRSSQVMPANSFKNTEFYNDWLTPLGRRHDGIGIKLKASADVPVILSMQLPDEALQGVESIMEPIIERVSGTLVRSIATTYLLRERQQKSLAAAAIIDREPEIAFAIDERLRIIEANGSGSRCLSLGSLAASQNGLLRLKSDRAQKWLQRAVALMGARTALADHRLPFSHEGGNFRMSLVRIPEYDPYGGNRFLFPRFLTLVIIRSVDGQVRPLDRSILPEFFRLTPAEVRMCEALLQNLTIAEAADRLQITRETARQRLKQIFLKTGTNRQAELIALLIRLS